MCLCPCLCRVGCGRRAVANTPLVLEWRDPKQPSVRPSAVTGPILCATQRRNHLRHELGQRAVAGASSGQGWIREGTALASEETVILLTSPLPLAGVSIRMERGCQQNGSLIRGQHGTVAAGRPNVDLGQGDATCLRPRPAERLRSPRRCELWQTFFATVATDSVQLQATCMQLQATCMQTAQ